MISVIAAFSLLTGALEAKASLLFEPTLDVQFVSPPTPTSNGNVARLLTVPAGHPLPARETLKVPADWDIDDVPNGDVVGTGTLLVNEGACPGAPAIFTFEILDEAAGSDKAHWRAIVNPADGGTLVFDFVVTGSAGMGHTIVALMFYDPVIQGDFCAPVRLTILHQGISLPGVSTPGLATVLTNPTLQGLYLWEAIYRPGPLTAPPHPDVTVSDNVAIGPDGDADDIPDFVDNCPSDSNFFQGDQDGDLIGDVCDDDIDGDGWTNLAENFISTNHLNPCAPLGWPPDPAPVPEGNGMVQIDDVSFAAGAFGSTTTPRAEIASQDGVVQIDDVSAVAGAFGAAC